MAAATRFAAIGFLPPSVKLKAFAHSTARTQLVVGKSSSLRYIFPDNYVGNLSPRAATLADMLASPLLLGYVARAAGIPASEIAVDAPLWTDLQRVQQWDTGQKRANQLVSEKAPYRITLNNVTSQAPVIDVVTQAHTTNAAVRLAQGVAVGLSTYLSAVQSAAHTPLTGRYDVSQLTPVSAEPASTALLANVGAFTFLGVLSLWCGLVLAAARVAKDLRAARARSKVGGVVDRSSDDRRHWPEPTGASTPTG